MNTGTGKRNCEWKDCPNEGRYRIQTSSLKDDIHWFCRNHARTFDLSVVSQGPFIGSGGPNWTQKPRRPKGQPAYNHRVSTSKINPNIRMRHVAEEQMLNYTKEDLENLKIMGLETGAKPDDIKKAYKTLVKHCHPDQNPELENGEYIFNKISEAYKALKDRDFK